MSLLLPGECTNARSTTSDNQQNQYQQTPTTWQLTNKTRRQVTNNGFNKASDNQQNQYQRPGSQVTNKRWQIINKTNTKELEDREIFQNIFGKSVWSTMHILKECCSCILSFCLHFLTVDLKHKRLNWLQSTGGKNFREFFWVFFCVYPETLSNICIKDTLFQVVKRCKDFPRI